MESYKEKADRRAHRFRTGMIFNGFVCLSLGSYSLLLACVAQMSTTLRVIGVIQGVLFIVFGGWSIRRYLIQGHTGHDDLMW
jgi:hypothetical protein